MEYEARKRITLVKRKLGGLGFLVKRNQNAAPLISNIVKGGEAEARGVEVGYVIEAEGISYEQIVDKLARVAVGRSVTISFKVAKRRNKISSGKQFTIGSTDNLKKVSFADRLDKGQENCQTKGFIMTDLKKENGLMEEVDENSNSVQSNGGMKDGKKNGTVASAKPEKTFVKLNNFISSKQTVDTLHQQSKELTCTKKACHGSILQPDLRPYGKMRPKEDVKEDAIKFLKDYYKSIKKNDTEDESKRIVDALKEIEEHGTYELDVKELVYGAKTAWRNSVRCIGRIQWNKLQVFDARDVTTARGMFDMICKHIKYGTNGGNIRSAITVFPQRREDMKDFRIWNSQFIKYAGYRQADGSVIGDQLSVDFTEICQTMGWKGKGTRFDVLPLVLQASGQDPEYFIIPPDLVMEVEMKHPEFPWFKDLGLKWYCLPAVANMLYDVGGVEFPCAPFNGWYMASEIGARNFGDVARYNMLQPVAQKIGLDTRTNTSLWKDRALIELNIAVLHSFNAAGVTIMDHHSASESFMKHLDNEQRLRGGCPADWVWIVPPLSGSTCPVFHQEMLAYYLRPSFEYQEDPYKYFPIGKQRSSGKRRLGFREVAKAVNLTARLMGQAMAKRHKAIILYATETGKSENYAKILGQLFSHAFDPKVMSMDEFNFPELEHEQLVLIVTSTFGNGEAPSNGENFGEMLYKMKHPPSLTKAKKRLSSIHIQSFSMDKQDTDSSQSLANLRFSVFGLGSRAYPHFCAFAHSCRNLIIGLGGEEVFPLGEGDELCGQEESFMAWAKDVFKAACETFCADTRSMTSAVESLTASASSWTKGKFRYTVVESSKKEDRFEGLAHVHNKKISQAVVLSKQNLQHPDSSRSTILVQMKTAGNEEQSYEPGDHLAVFAVNSSELVNALIGLIDNAPGADEPIKMEICKETSGPFGPIKRWEVIKRLPSPCALRAALTSYLDLTTPPTPQLLMQLATQATDEEEKKVLEDLGKGSSTYEDWKYDRYPNIVEVLEEFPSVKVDVMLLLTQLPLLQSRYYSISSSPLLYPDEVHVTVAVVNYRTQGGKGPLHHGVCSTWLDSLKPGDTVPCFVRSAPSFHLPDDPYLPVLMVGPGTGIAPFRSFWQHRFYQISNGVQKEELGPMELYFGCRTSNLDYLYKDELMNMHEGGILDGCCTAFSREPGQPKQYVQDLLKANSEDVCEMILLNGGHIYVCGDVSMANDVAKTMLNLLQEFAALSQNEAQDCMSQLRSSGRYHEDIFGVTLRTAEVTDRVRTAAKKNRALSFVGGSSTGEKPHLKKRHTLSFIEGVTNKSSQNGTPAKALLRQQKIEQGELRKSELMADKRHASLPGGGVVDIE